MSHCVIFLLFLCVLHLSLCGSLQLFIDRCFLPSSAIQESHEVHQIRRSSSRPLCGNDLSMLNSVALSLLTVQLPPQPVSAPRSKPQTGLVTRQAVKAAVIHLVVMSITDHRWLDVVFYLSCINDCHIADCGVCSHSSYKNFSEFRVH